MNAYPPKSSLQHKSKKGQERRKGFRYIQGLLRQQQQREIERKKERKREREREKERKRKKERERKGKRERKREKKKERKKEREWERRDNSSCARINNEIRIGKNGRHQRPLEYSKLHFTSDIE